MSSSFIRRICLDLNAYGPNSDLEVHFNARIDDGRIEIDPCSVTTYLHDDLRERLVILKSDDERNVRDYLLAWETDSVIQEWEFNMRAERDYARYIDPF